MCLPDFLRLTPPDRCPRDLTKTLQKSGKNLTMLPYHKDNIKQTGACDMSVKKKILKLTFLFLLALAIYLGSIMLGIHMTEQEERSPQTEQMAISAG